MQHKFLKLAGVKTEKEFYAKFPTEEAFFKAHPEAHPSFAKGGTVPSKDVNTGEFLNTRLGEGSSGQIVPLPDGFEEQPGPKPRKPIVVTNPNDPRLKAYNDSLKMNKLSLDAAKDYYNGKELKTELFNKTNSLKQYKAVLNSSTSNDAPIPYWYSNKMAKLRDEWNKNKMQPVGIYNSGHGMGDLEPPYYQKPVQPVVYQKPQPTSVKQSQAYNDSLKLYIQGEKDFKEYQKLNKTNNIPASSTRKWNDPIKYDGLNLAKIQPIEGNGYYYNHNPDVVSGTNVPSSKTNNYTFRYKKPVGTSIPKPIEQPEKIFPFNVLPYSLRA